MIPQLGAFPVRKGQADRGALRAALDLLAAGEVVALFPEGDMYADDTMHPFERGIGYLAAASGAPVVPAAITGSYAISDGRWLGRPTIRLTVGEPVDFGGIEGRGHDACARRASLVEAAVRELREQGELAAEQAEQAEREAAARRRERAGDEWRWEPESTFLWGERVARTGASGAARTGASGPARRVSAKATTGPSPRESRPLSDHLQAPRPPAPAAGRRPAPPSAACGRLGRLAAARWSTCRPGPGRRRPGSSRCRSPDSGRRR